MQIAGLQEEIDNLGSLMVNSTVGIDSCSSNAQAPTSRHSNGTEFSWKQDATSTEFFHHQMANLLSHQGFSTEAAYQDLERQVNIEFPQTLQLEDQLYEESGPNPLETFLSGIDQEVFMNHPWSYVQP